MGLPESGNGHRHDYQKSTPLPKTRFRSLRNCFSTSRLASHESMNRLRVRTRTTVPSVGNITDQPWSWSFICFLFNFDSFLHRSFPLVLQIQHKYHHVRDTPIQPFPSTSINGDFLPHPKLSSDRPYSPFSHIMSCSPGRDEHTCAVLLHTPHKAFEFHCPERYRR
jgi:hypothetical protein